MRLWLETMQGEGKCLIHTLALALVWSWYNMGSYNRNVTSPRAFLILFMASNLPGCPASFSIISCLQGWYCQLMIPMLGCCKLIYISWESNSEYSVALRRLILNRDHQVSWNSLQQSSSPVFAPPKNMISLSVHNLAVHFDHNLHLI